MMIEGGWNNTENNYTDSNETRTLGIKYRNLYVGPNGETEFYGCSLDVGLYCKHG